MCASTLFNIILQEQSEIDKLTELAESGDINSQYELGNLYDLGEVVQRDWSKSFYWLSKVFFVPFSVVNDYLLGCRRRSFRGSMYIGYPIL